MGTRLTMSTAFHPQTDGQSERTIQVLEDMLRACVLDHKGSWEEHLPLVEFAYNNSYQASIQMAPYEALYGRPCRLPLCWTEVGESSITGPDLIRDTSEKVSLIRHRLLTAQSRYPYDPGRMLVEFSYNNSYQASIQMAPYEALYGRLCRSSLCWTEVGESSITGPDLIRETSEKVSLIRQRLLTAQSRQKSYADVRRRPLEFEVGDHVFLKIMLKRGVIRFGKRGNLSPRFIGPFEIVDRVGTVAYRLVLPPSMSSVHEVFHVSMLRKYTPDPAHVMDWRQIEVDIDGTFEEGPVRIVDSRDQVMRRKTVRLVKVLWRHY